MCPLADDSSQPSDLIQHLDWVNPFATHRVRAGAIPYHFAQQNGWEQILADLQCCRWVGQIVGPHGTGKTTLLRSLEHHLAQHDRHSVFVSLRDRQRRLPKIEWGDLDSQTVVMIDGYEQLSWIARFRLRWNSWRRCGGLIVTSHRPVWGLPLVFKTTSTLELVHELAKQLGGDTVTAAMIENRFEQAAGNVRETWMLLYDDAELAYRAEE